MYKVLIAAALLFGYIAHAQLLPPSLGSDALVLIGANGNTVSLQPGTISTSFTLTLPTNDGTNGDFLQTDGNGVMSWASASTAGNPSGTIITFAGSTCPAGYLDADGSAVSRTTYSTLFGAIGSTWGAGDGSTTFNLPDLRNRFLRGTGSNADGNGGTAVSLGTYQSDAFQSHWHYTRAANGSGGGPGNMNSLPSFYTPGNNSHPTYGQTYDAVVDSSGVTPRTATETRPKAYGVLMCIKI